MIRRSNPGIFLAAVCLAVSAAAENENAAPHVKMAVVGAPGAAGHLNSPNLSAKSIGVNPESELSPAFEVHSMNMTPDGALVTVRLEPGAAFTSDISAAAGSRDFWSRAVTQAFSQAGTDSIARLGIPELSRLAGVALSGPTLSEDELIAALGDRVRELAAGPEAFAKLTPEEKVALIREAFLKTRAAADKRTTTILAVTPEELTKGTLPQMEDALHDISPADYFFLSPERRAAVDVAARQTAAFKENLRRWSEDWAAVLPGKIFAGAFDGPAQIAKYQDGWAISENWPESTNYATYAAAFDARLKQIKAMPSGPWQAQAAAELEANVKDAGIAKKIRGEGADPIAFARAVAELRRSYELFILTGDRKTDKALGAFIWQKTSQTGPAAEAKDAIEVLRHYDRLAERIQAPSFSAATKWRVLSTLVKGEPLYGYRYLSLKNFHYQAIRRASDAVYRGMKIFALSFIAGVAAYVSHAPLLLTLAFLALALSSVSYMLISHLRYDSWQGIGKAAERAVEDFRARLRVEPADAFVRLHGAALRKTPGVAAVEAMSKPLPYGGDWRYVRVLVEPTADFGAIKEALSRYAYAGAPVEICCRGWKLAEIRSNGTLVTEGYPPLDARMALSLIDAK